MLAVFDSVVLFLGTSTVTWRGGVAVAVRATGLYEVLLLATQACHYLLAHCFLSLSAKLSKLVPHMAHGGLVAATCLLD